MSEKCLNIIQRFSQSDLSQFLQKNGYGEFEDVLNKGGITNGEAFLNLNELQMLHWKLSPSTKNKLLSLLTEIKQNAQKFVGKTETDKFGSINRRHSFVHPQIDFKKKLEQVISSKSVKESLILSKPNLEEAQSLNECLYMNSGSEVNLFKAHYDECGYLLPINRTLIEENDCEPPPSDILINPGGTISQRAPLTLPRDTTDERGYILGPRDLSTLVDNKKSPLHVFPRLRSPGNTPSPTSPRPFPKVLPSQAKHEKKNEERVDNERSDGEEYLICLSSKPVTIENQTGCLPRLFRFLRKCKKSEIKQNERKERKEQDKKNKHKVLSLKHSARPLSSLSAQDFSEATDQESPETCENFKERNKNFEDISNENHQNTQDFKEDTKSWKSQSESVTSEEELPSMQEDKKKNEFPESEQYRIGNTLLPLPPKHLPQITVHEEMLPGEEYVNPNNDPFYRNTNRKGAKMLLLNLDDGAFLFRSSKRSFLTLVLKCKGKYHNLAIQKTKNNRITLKGCISPKFASLHDLVEHFTRELLTFQRNGEVVETYLNKTLPFDRC